MGATAHVVELLQGRGLEVVDLRGQLPAHPSKNYRRRVLADVSGVCLHHAGGRPTGRAAVFSYARYHVESRDWPGVGYWAQIDDAGIVYVCHDLEVSSYAQGFKARPGDENAEFVGVLVQGFFRSGGYLEEDEPTADQLASAMVLWCVLRDALNLPPSGLRGHYEFGKPACPGSTLETMIRAVQFRHAHDEPRKRWERASLQTWAGRQRGLQLASELCGAKRWDPGAVDGVLGPATLRALQAFQAANGLQPDGLWGPKTDAVLRDLLEEGAG